MRVCNIPNRQSKLNFWLNEFKRGRKFIKNEAGPFRTTTKKMIDKIQGMVMEDRPMTSRLSKCKISCYYITKF